MDYCILRVEKRKLPAARAMARHALREQQTPNADPTRFEQNQVLRGPKTAAKVVAILGERTEPLVRREDAVRVVEFFVGGSPEKMHAMTPAQRSAYFEKSLAWIQGLFDGDAANIVMAVVHNDETTPHLQVLVTPIVGDKLAANAVIGGPSGLVKLQDDFHAKVGATFKMRRGERGSRAKHTSIKAFYAAMEQAGSLNALPQRRPMPPVPTPPGMVGGAAAREAFEKAKAEYDQVKLHNERVQNEIDGLARLALSAQALNARRLPSRLARARETIEQSKLAEGFIRKANEIAGLQTAEQNARLMAEVRKERSASSEEPASTVARPSPFDRGRRRPAAP